MKPLILVVAVATFELAFLASIASTPTPAPEVASATRAQGPGERILAQRAGDPVPCTPRG